MAQYIRRVICVKKFEGMLFCTDLDGTLFTDDKTVSKENLDAIEYFKSEGGLFTFITGRVPMISKEICDLIHPNAPYGCLNGGGICDSKTNDYLWNRPLSNDVIDLVQMVDKEMPEMGIQYNTETNVYFCKDNAAMVDFRKITGLPNVSRPFEEIHEPIMKVLFVDESMEQLELLIELLHRHPKASKFDFVRSEKCLYEILPKNISKGILLCKMAEMLGIDMRNTVAVGDYNNDVSMIKAAGMGFAVANAVDEAKQAADYVTVSNNDHAIAAIIEGLDNGTFTLK